MSDDNSSKTVIELQDLWAGYGGDNILKSINLSVKELDYIGIIGPNGGGKTTLFKVLLGLLNPHWGQVTIFGRTVQQGRRYIGYVPQIIHFDRSFPINVSDVVRMGRLGRNRLFNRFNRKDDEQVEKALHQVNLLNLRDRPISELSGGQLQRVYIARALATEPRILLLDEPTAGLDNESSTAIYELLRDINEYATILMISHDVGTISSHVKTIGCLNRKLYYHGENQVTGQMLAQTYGSPMDRIVHGQVSQRILTPHDSEEC